MDRRHGPHHARLHSGRRRAGAGPRAPGRPKVQVQVVLTRAAGSTASCEPRHAPVAPGGLLRPGGTHACRPAHPHQLARHAHPSAVTDKRARSVRTPAGPHTPSNSRCTKPSRMWRAATRRGITRSSRAGRVPSPLHSTTPS